MVKITQINDNVYFNILNGGNKRKEKLIGLYIYLTRNRDYATNLTTHRSLAIISKDLNTSINCIKESIDELVELGLLEYYAGDSRGYSNMYAFPLEGYEVKSRIPDYCRNTKAIHKKKEPLDKAPNDSKNESIKTVKNIISGKEDIVNE